MADGCPWAGAGKRESWSMAEWTQANLSCCGASALVCHVVQFVRNLGGGRTGLFSWLEKAIAGGHVKIKNRK